MILVAGSANLDFVVRASHIPQPGETVLGQSFTTYPGGKGANQAVAAARAGGASTHMLLGLGHDSFATHLEQSLTQAGVVQHIVRTPVATGTAFICVSDEGENAITVAPGANAELAAQHLPPLQGYSHLLMQLETPLDTVQAYATAARQQGVCVVLNAAPAQSLPSALLALVDILVVNEGELAAIAQHPGSIAECLQRIQVPTVVVTLGSRGCCARMGTQFVVQNSFAVEPVDTTGAGDTFCGTLVASLSQGLDMGQALQRASAAGALACTMDGAQSSIPSAQAVQALVAATPAMTEQAAQALRSYCGL